MEKPKIYIIIDLKKEAIRNPVRLAKDAIKGGADLIQLRFKDLNIKNVIKIGASIRRISKKAGVPLIINDNIAVLFALDADGLHLGQDDFLFNIARNLLGKKRIIGVSCHNLQQAKRAEVLGADYISMGPVFATITKPQVAPIGLNLLRRAADSVKVPIFAIGGINAANVKEVLNAGAKNIACISAIERAENPAEATRLLKSIINGKIK